MTRIKLINTLLALQYYSRAGGRQNQRPGADFSAPGAIFGALLTHIWVVFESKAILFF